MPIYAAIKVEEEDEEGVAIANFGTAGQVRGGQQDCMAIFRNPAPAPQVSSAIMFNLKFKILCYIFFNMLLHSDMDLHLDCIPLNMV